MINTSRLTYRTAQFCRTLLAKADTVETAKIRADCAARSWSKRTIRLIRRHQESLCRTAFAR